MYQQRQDVFVYTILGSLRAYNGSRSVGIYNLWLPRSMSIHVYAFLTYIIKL